MNWTVEKGQILKHKTLSQRVVVGERHDFGGAIFWEISERDRYGTGVPWMIGEQNLIEQYDLTEGKAP